MKRILIGILLGTVAGIVDVIPMLLQNLTWDANISAFIMWVVIGIILVLVEFKMNSILKGILISLLVISPTGVLIAWNEPESLIPISIMTVLLGGFLGYSTNKILSNQSF